MQLGEEEEVEAAPKPEASSWEPSQPQGSMPGGSLANLEDWPWGRANLLPNSSGEGSAVGLGLTEPTAAEEG